MRKLVVVLAGCAAMLLGIVAGTGPKPCEQEQFRPTGHRLQRRPPPDLQLRRCGAASSLPGPAAFRLRRRLRRRPAPRLADIFWASGKWATVPGTPFTSPWTTMAPPGARFIASTGSGSYVNGEARVTWDDGAMDAIRRIDGKDQKFAYRAGKTFTDEPDNVTAAQKHGPGRSKAGIWLGHTDFGRRHLIIDRLDRRNLLSIRCVPFSDEQCPGPEPEAWQRF